MMILKMGPLAAKLEEQLRGIPLDRFDVINFDLDKKAINRLHIRGLITKAQSDQAFKRLIKTIEKTAKEYYK